MAELFKLLNYATKSTISPSFIVSSNPAGISDRSVSRLLAIWVFTTRTVAAGPVCRSRLTPTPMVRNPGAISQEQCIARHFSCRSTCA